MSTNSISVPAEAAAGAKHFKVTLAQDTRRFSLSGADAGAQYAQLLATARQLFDVPAQASVTLKYKDPEGDAITIGSAFELAEAFKVAGAQPLRLQMAVVVIAATAAPMMRLAPATPAPAPAVVVAPMLRLAPAIPAPAQAASPKMASLTSATPALSAAANAPSASEAPRANIATVLKERNAMLRERLAECKLQMHELRMQRKGDVVQVHGLRRELETTRGEALPRWRQSMLARGRFVADVSQPDGTTVPLGATVIKTWRFRNDHATEAWSAGSRLLWVGGDRLGAPDEVLVQREVRPGDEIDLSMPITAPAAPGRYCLFARLADATGRRFGQRVWASLVAAAPSDASSGSSDEEATPVAHAPAAHAPAAHAPAAHAPAAHAPARAPISEAAVAKYARQLQVLGELGLTQFYRNVHLLDKFDGQLEPVVERLLAHRAHGHHGPHGPHGPHHGPHGHGRHCRFNKSEGSAAATVVAGTPNTATEPRPAC